jgi:hypothetical protein
MSKDRREGQHEMSAYERATERLASLLGRREEPEALDSAPASGPADRS